jgi:cytochrome P450
MEDGHLAFGAGPHVCLGQHIAKIEIDAMLREVLTRMTDFELAGPPEWLPSNFISGPKAMPLRFRPA